MITTISDSNVSILTKASFREVSGGSPPSNDSIWRTYLDSVSWFSDLTFPAKGNKIG